MKKAAYPTVKLKVEEIADRKDFGLGIARMSNANMKRIGMKAGDIVDVIGARSTNARLVPAFPADEKINIVKIDGLVRKKSGVSIGELVTVKKASPGIKIVRVTFQDTKTGESKDFNMYGIDVEDAYCMVDSLLVKHQADKFFDALAPQDG